MSVKVAFKRATRTQARLRLALVGPSGSGKTYSALRIAAGLGERIAVIDTERGSASKYAGTFGFDVLELESFHPERYAEAIRAAEAAGYEVLVIDSLSHAWMGRDGALEQVDRAAKRGGAGNSFAAWRDVTPMHNALVDTILGARLHVIATMRAKTEYVLETNDRGKQVPRKVGMAPVQRDGMEYEFDVTGDMTLDHDFVVTKTRCPTLDGRVVRCPGEELGVELRAWLTDGAPGRTPEPRVEREPEAEPVIDVDALARRKVAAAQRLDSATRILGRERAARIAGPKPAGTMPVAELVAWMEFTADLLEAEIEADKRGADPAHDSAGDTPWDPAPMGGGES